MQASIFSATLEDARHIAPEVRHFIFRIPDNVPFDYLPGQFVTIHFEHAGKTLRRSYSIANPPAKSNLVEFAAGYVEGGPASNLLFGLQPGDTVNMNGPFGRLTLRDENAGRLVLVATSTGVTPYHAMLPELSRRLAANSELEVVILEGVRTREDLLYPDAFFAFAKNFPRARFIPCFSRERTESLQPGAFAGYVHHYFPELALNPEQDTVYLCGNPGMIDDAFEWLKEKGFASQRVIREKYISR